MILSRYRSLENSKVNNMATVKVAVRVRPFNQRELELNCQRIIEMENKKTRIFNTKIPVSAQDGDIGRERIKEFSYDFSHWSFDSKDENFVSQEQVFEDLGTDVVDSAFEGYNACVFAYGQTGSGKTHTMMGSLEAVGLIPRICQKIFEKMKKHKDPGTTCRTEISYLEIYNEKVKDLLKDGLSHRSLRVREHPRRGPYVEDLSKHFVMDYSDIHDLMMKGNALRSTASTNMNDVSSRSHAIFTITFVQAKFDEDTPSETVSKINLVDLAGSERADVTGATGQRLKEGGHINKSLVTLGSVISALADLSSSNSRGKNIFIPYRDSTLTWLLKDSLGGNSRTIMIATISPADVNYGETLSTLRYANRAKNIINKPTINEDPNVKLIRELRSEIAKLRALLVNNNNTNCSFVVEKLHANEAKVKVLTEAWTERWRETQKILEEQQNLALRKSGVGVILDSDMPHLVGIDDSVFSTGITFYPLKEGITYIGGEDGAQKQNIVLDGLEPEHCRIELINGQAFLIPIGQSPCYIDTNLIDKSTKLTHGCVVMLGKTIMFRYNDPAEAAKLRKEKENGSNLNLSSLSRLSFLSWSSPDLARSMENLSCRSDFDENGNGDISKYLFSSPQIMKDNSNLEKIQEKQASPFTLENSSQVRGNLELEELLAVEKLKIREELEKQKEELKLKMESEITHLEELKQQLDKEKNKYHEEFVQKQKQLEAERHCLEQWEKQLQTLASSKTFRKCDENIDTIESIDIKISEDNDKSTSESQHIPLEGFKEPNNLIHQDFLLMEQEKELNSEAILQHQDTFQESHLINSLCVENDKVEFLSEGNKLQYNKETKNLKNFDQQMNINLDLLHDNYKSFCDSPVDIKNSEWENLQKPELMLDLVYPVVEKIEQKESSFLPYEEENSEINDGLLNLDQGHSKLVQNPDLNKLYTYLQQDVIGLDPTSSNSPTSTIEHLHTLTEKYKQMSDELDVKTTEIDESNLSVETENFAHLKQSLSEISKSTEKLIKDLNLKESISSGCSTPSPESDISPLSSMMYRISSPQLTDRARIALDEVCEDVYLAIPSFIMLGSGKTQHHEYEIKILIKNETWTIFRRYKRFRELHQMMKQKFNMNNSIKLPPKRIFGSKSDEFAEERKKQLEKYLHNLLRWCFTAKECPLSSSELASKAFLCDLIPFFRKGIFDSNKLRTG